MPSSDTRNFFAKVEALRKHMILTTAQMAKVLGTTRVTYSGWVNGKAIRKTNEDRVKQVLRNLLAVVTEHEWPKPEVIALASSQRFNTLLEILKPEE